MNLVYSESMVYPWKTNKNISFRGYFIYESHLYKDEEAILFISKNIEESGLKGTLSKLNGLFSIVINDEQKEEIILVVDRLRNLPIFYSLINNEILISNSIAQIKNEIPEIAIDNFALEEFLITEKFVTSSQTLLKGVKQVQAGEYVIYNKFNKEVRSLSYFNYRDSGISDFEIEKKFKEKFEISSKNLEILLNKRTAVVPLTGGVDSRELLLMLSSINYTNVICYTCGKKNSKESKIAEKVAKNFGYQWIGIEYTPQKWRELSKKELFQDYREFSSNYSNLPHILEIVGLEELKKTNQIPRNSVFLPGHAGAVVGGRIPIEFHEKSELNIDEVKRIMIREFYMGNQEGLKFFENSLNLEQNDFLGYFHEFEMKERQSKFICNSVRLYEFFGYEWALPLCDVNFLNLMKEVPLEYKKNKKLVRNFIGMTEIESTADNSFYKEIASKLKKIPIIRKNARKYSKIPKYWTDPLLTGSLYGSRKYFKTLFKSGEFFSINSIEKELFLMELEREVSKQ